MYVTTLQCSLMHKWIQPIKSSGTLCQNYSHMCFWARAPGEDLEMRKCFGMFCTYVCTAYLCGRMVNTVGCTVCTFLLTIPFIIFRPATLAQHLHSLCYTTNTLPAWTELLCYTYAVCTYRWFPLLHKSRLTTYSLVDNYKEYMKLAIT